MPALPTIEAEVRSQFDRSQGRFRELVEPDDFRLEALMSSLGPVDALRILDLGCGKGRFAARLRAHGANVVGLDLAAGMLRGGHGPRVQASARRLPFADGSFDDAYAVEVFQHVPDRAIGPVLAELSRVVRPGGLIVVIDRNALALDVNRPWLPAVVVKGIDRARGRWIYPLGSPAREGWFVPARLAKALGHHFESVAREMLTTPQESSSWPFRSWPWSRAFAIWTGRKPGGS